MSALGPGEFLLILLVAVVSLDSNRLMDLIFWIKNTRQKLRHWQKNFENEIAANFRDQEIIFQINQWENFKNANRILIYKAKSHQPNLTKIAEIAHQQNKTVSYYFLSKNNQLQFEQYESKSKSDLKNKRKPNLSQSPEKPDLLFIPGRSFNYQNERLGSPNNRLSQMFPKEWHSKFVGIGYKSQFQPLLFQRKPCNTTISGH